MGCLSVIQDGQINDLGNLVTLLLPEEALSCMDTALALVGILTNSILRFLEIALWKESHRAVLSNMATKNYMPT